MTEHKQTIGGVYLTKYLNAKHIKNHMPILKDYGRQCAAITEMGVREFNSTWAFLSAKPKKLTSIDWNRPPFEICQTELSLCRELALEADVQFEFISADTLTIDIAPTDLLFIDTWHTYEQLSMELYQHSKNVEKFILVHDINERMFPGMSWAVMDFIKANPCWYIGMMNMDGPGMAVLQRSKTAESVAWFDLKETLDEIRHQQVLYYEATNQDGSISEGWEAYRKVQFQKFGVRR